jgi:hypothetical protein
MITIQTALITHHQHHGFAARYRLWVRWTPDHCGIQVWWFSTRAECENMLAGIFPDPDRLACGCHKECDPYAHDTAP